MKAEDLKLPADAVGCSGYFVVREQFRVVVTSKAQSEDYRHSLRGLPLFKMHVIALDQDAL